MTRELFDLIVELRPSTTSAALAENVRRKLYLHSHDHKGEGLTPSVPELHLLEHHERFLEYLQFFRLRLDSPLTPLHLEPFENVSMSKWLRSSISDELVTEIFTMYGERTRKKESSQYTQTLMGDCISLDNTFKVMTKATVTDSKKQRSKPLKGGLLSAVNERNEIITWVRIAPSFVFRDTHHHESGSVKAKPALRSRSCWRGTSAGVTFCMSGIPSRRLSTTVATSHDSSKGCFRRSMSLSMCGIFSCGKFSVLKRANQHQPSDERDADSGVTGTWLWCSMAPEIPIALPSPRIFLMLSCRREPPRSRKYQQRTGRRTSKRRI